jgi:transglutaminase-like putative cysteine protease
MTLRSVLFFRPRASTFVRPSRTLFFLIAGSFLLTLVPHVIQFPLWVTVSIIAALVIRSLLEVYRLPLPSHTFSGIIAMLFFGAIIVQFHRISGREAGTALTAGLLAIKFYELRRPRDVALIIFSCFFVVMSALLYSQVLELFAYCLIMMWVLTALLLRVHTGDLPRDNLLRMLGHSGIIFLQALPLACFLFVFFPRYTGKLSLSLDEPTIGLTDTVGPGSIARLADDDSEAMYVKFTSGNFPLQTQDMYWRALVLWNYENGIWTPGPLAATEPSSKVPPIKAGPGQVSQEITVRQHNQKWLFALDFPITLPVNGAESLSPSWAVMLNGHVLQVRYGKLDYTARYTVVSSGIPPEEQLGSAEKSLGIQLPADIDTDPRVRALADQLHSGLSDGQEQEYIFAVIGYFRHNGFVYSTAPGDQGPDWLPVFLFKTKIGFCEHYASAFGVLMRLEHIPTRLVTGYQGADYNPYSNHYIVSQSNAHAWDEVWIPDKNQAAGGNWGHWMRIDPTALLAAAAPGTAADNSGAAGNDLSSQIARHRSSFADAYLPAWARSSLREMTLRREQVETDWDNLVFSYDPETQTRLAEALGFGPQARAALLLGCLVVGGICIAVFGRWMARKPTVSLLETLYTDFCRRMARRGIPRAVWEGPLAYTQRVAEAFPEDQQAIHRVGSIVAHARYGPELDPAAPQDLKSVLTLLSASQAASSSRERA